MMQKLKEEITAAANRELNRANEQFPLFTSKHEGVAVAYEELEESKEALEELEASFKCFAKLRDKQGRKVYTIVNHGNTGTIDEVPYIINSACAEIGGTKDAYCMAYGPLSNYEVAVFSDIDAQKSTEYKFKQGQIAYKASVFMGGNVVARNGFIRVKNPSA